MNYIVFFYDNKAFITTLVKDEKNHAYIDVIAIATLNTNDCLYYIEDMKVFKFHTAKRQSLVNLSSPTTSLSNELINLTFNDKPYTLKQIKEGSSKVKSKSTRRELNKKEWLHVRLNHASEAVIDHVVKHDLCIGTGVTWSEIKDLHLGICDTCMHSQMKKFPIQPSISHKEYGIFEYITGDYVSFKKPSIRGYTGAIIYMDKCTGKVFEYKVKAKSEWLYTLKRLIKEYGHDRYPRSLLLRYLLTDYATEVHSTEFTLFLSDSNIELLNSTPYLHEQNLIERFIQVIKKKLRTALMYNRAPYYLWCYALTYVCDTFNMLPRTNKPLSPNEAFYGEKQDVSKCVPFYASGWYYVTKEERQALPSNSKEKLIDDRAMNCLMLGYTNPYIIPDKTQARIFIKNAYICYNPVTNVELVRHDCLFKHYPDHLDPLNYEVLKDNPHEDENFDYGDLFEVITPSLSTIDSMKINKNEIEKSITDSANVAYRQPVNDSILIEPISTLDVGIDITSCQPTKLSDALASNYKDNWSWAFKTEMERLGIRDTWTIVPYDPKLPEYKTIKPIKSKFAFRASVRPNGTIKFRCRLVACGYSQQLGIDYDTTYCPTWKFKSLCIVLHLAAIHGWSIQGIDVENAFIEPVIDKPIYMYLPKDVFFDEQTKAPVVVRLNKSIYGLKQAGDLWYKLLNDQFIKMNYKRSIHDNCVYVKFIDTSKIYIVVYVDDVLFIGNDMKIIDSTINTLIDNLTKLNQIERVERYIGLDIKRDFENHTISLSQYPYTQQYINTYVDSTKVKEVETPLLPSVNYKEVSDDVQSAIQEQIGKLRFLADRTRPDILTAVGILGTHAAKPSLIQTKGLKVLGDYLKTTYPMTPLTLGGKDENVILFGYCDASNQPADKSRLAYTFYVSLDSGTIYARSFRAKSVSHSACQSEIMALDEAIRQIIWLRGLLEELGFIQNEPTIIYTDSESARILIETMNIGNNSAHLVMRLNFLHECVVNKIVSIKYINTNDQVADVLTKILPIHGHNKHTNRLLKGHSNIKPETLSLIKKRKTKIIKSKSKIISKIKLI